MPARCSACLGWPMRRSCWLVSAPYDLSFIIGSAILLFVPHAVHLLWPSAIVVDLVIAAAIGGPHLFATYTLTFMEPNFRRRYPRYTAGALLLPLLVLVTAIVHLDLLVTAFFFLAALHVIHQAGYVADSYRARRPEPAAALGLSRLIDYGLLLSSLFVLATFKFTGAPPAHLRHGAERAPVRHRRPPPAVSRVPAGGGVGLGADAGVGALCRCVHRQVRARGGAGAPQPAQDAAPGAGRRPVLRHPGAAEPRRGVPGTEHLALRSSTWRW